MNAAVLVQCLNGWRTRYLRYYTALTVSVPGVIGKMFIDKWREQSDHDPRRFTPRNLRSSPPSTGSHRESARFMTKIGAMAPRSS